MKKSLFLFSTLVALVLAGCSKDDDKEEEQGDVLYKIVNNGNGGVNTTSDSDDSTPLGVVQAVPAVQGGDYPKSMPIILFFNDKIYLNSLENGIEVTQNGNLIGGTVYINEGANGFAIMTFVPSDVFEIGSDISFNLEGIQDDGGNELENGSYSLNFGIGNMSFGEFDGNGGFENNNGVLFLGDGAIMSGQNGCVSPVAGNNFAAITSGEQLISSGSAIGDASSMMILGTINEGISSLSFSYNFLSAEFNEYVNSQYDDTAIVTVVGPNNAYSEFLTSVNTVGIDGNTECIGFPNMPDDGDSYNGSTGWINKTINFQNVGSPAFIIFTITDVADTIYSSVLAVDEVSY